MSTSDSNLVSFHLGSHFLFSGSETHGLIEASKHSARSMQNIRTCFVRLAQVEIK